MKTLFLGAVALAMLGTPAMAQRYYDRDGDAPRYNRDYGYNRDRDYGFNRGYGREDFGPRRLREGGTVPYEFRSGGRYIYYDWRDAGLRRPPRGYEWMLIGNQLVLADQHNGYIIDARWARNIRY